MKIRSQLASLATAFACILTLGGCGNNVPVLRSVAISPTSETIGIKTTQQFTASAQYSDGSVKDATSLVTWSSSNAAVATIAVGGVATALAFGTTMITATAAGAPSATATLSVNRLQSVTVTPSNQNVPNGKTQQFTATGAYRNPDGTTSTTDVTSLDTGPDAVVSAATDLTNLVADPSGTYIYVLDSGNATTNGQLMGFPDWTHTNAVLYSPDDGNLIVSMRHQNWISTL